MNTPDPSPPAASEAELPWHPITELKIERSLKIAKGTTAPGEDNLLMLIWKKIWGHLKSFIVSILTACVYLGHHPRQWRSAKIVVLRKPGKPDYSVPGAFRPIALLNTLGKMLEAVMARRLSYGAEEHNTNGSEIRSQNRHPSHMRMSSFRKRAKKQCVYPEENLFSFSRFTFQATRVLSGGGEAYTHCLR